MLTIKEYIAICGGTKKTAQKLSVPATTVKSWRIGARLPSPQIAMRLIDASNGLLSWDSLYRGNSPDPRYSNDGTVRWRTRAEQARAVRDKRDALLSELSQKNTAKGRKG